MAHPKWVRKVFSERDLQDIAAAVDRVERAAAAEVRVHLEQRVHHRRGETPDALTRAQAVFHHLGMHKTRHRNGVLVYLALDDRKLAIVGDEAIHARVGDAYWERVRDLMTSRLSRLGERGRQLATVAAVIGHPFDVQEFGWAFALPAQCDHFTWDRKAIWTWYPETHIGRPHGTATPDSTVPSPVTRQAVVKHLGALGDAGLVDAEREGREVRYRLNPAPMAGAMAWMAAIGAEWDSRLAALDRHVRARTPRRKPSES